MKKTKALFVLLFYSIFLIIFSTEIILNEFMNARREFLVKSSNKTSETLILTKEFWLTINDKREFSFENKYYDLISHQSIGDKIIVRVVSDDFEVVLKKTAENLTKKNSKNKKHSSISIIQFITKTTNIQFFKVKKNTLALPKYFVFFDDNFSCSIFQPPKLIELT